MKLNIKIKKAVVLKTHGTDLIYLTIDDESAFPIMGYDTIMKIECQQGYGEEYCRKILKLEPEVLDVR